MRSENGIFLCTLRELHRAAELKGSIAMLEECGFSSVMTKAAKERMEDMEQFDFAARYVEKKPDGWNEIIQVMKEEK